MGALRKLAAKAGGKWKAAHDRLPYLPPCRWQDNSVWKRLSGASSSPARAKRPPSASAEPSEFAKRGLCNGPLDWLLRPLVLAIVGVSGRAYMHLARGLSLQNVDSFRSALSRRTSGQGLLTACNHSSAVDDPLLLAASVSPQSLLQPSALRWSTCASDRCFKSSALARTLRCGKVLPVDRGAGLEQEGMRLASSKLAAGHWVHVFPEGTRRGERGVGQFKRGIGKLVLEGRSVHRSGERQHSLSPLVLPFAHAGMSVKRSNVNIAFGEPVDVSDIVERFDKGQATEQHATDAIAARVEQHVRVLHNLVQQNRAISHTGRVAAEELRQRDGRAESVGVRNAAWALPLWPRESEHPVAPGVGQPWLWERPAASFVKAA